VQVREAVKLRVLVKLYGIVDKVENAFLYVRCEVHTNILRHVDAENEELRALRPLSFLIPHRALSPTTLGELVGIATKVAQIRLTRIQ